MVNMAQYISHVYFIPIFQKKNVLWIRISSQVDLSTFPLL